MSEKKRILIAYATAGSGHKKAALAVLKAFKRRGSEAELKIVDILDYSSPFLRKTYAKTYVFLIKRLSFLWGVFYYSLNIRFVNFLLAPLRRALHISNSRKFIRLLSEFRPHVVISTHFMPPDACFYAVRKYGLKIETINVITDCRAHGFWISPGVNVYAVGHKRVKDELMLKWRISEEQINVTGIPVEGKFLCEEDAISMRKKLGIAPGSFVVLLLSGGDGVGPVIKILKALEKASFSLTAIAVSGYNTGLRAKIECLKVHSPLRIINLGFVNNVNELMTVSDICIGKAGGISTSEGLAKELPFIFVNPIPGQERANADLFVDLGAGLEIKGTRGILDLINEIRSSGDKIETLKHNIRKMRKPDPAGKISEFAERI